MSSIPQTQNTLAPTASPSFFSQIRSSCAETTRAVRNLFEYHTQFMVTDILIHALCFLYIFNVKTTLIVMGIMTLLGLFIYLIGKL
jgi:ABC-type transport system involved in cytochrome bd biosynthesis fused ATPase/permease subunit